MNYPIVQGSDNEKYLTTTFEGKKNKLGAIFMDYRCDSAFQDSQTIIYGHNVNNGSMFGSLGTLLNQKQYPVMEVIRSDDTILTYEIFEVKITDVEDDVYQLTAESAEASSVITLSTCTTSKDKEERLIVRARLIES